MSERVLINQLDEHNEGGILAVKHFNVTRCIYLYTKEQKEVLKQIKSYYENNLNKVKIEEVLIEEGDIEGIYKVINSNKDFNLIVNVAGGKRINSLLLASICMKESIISIYVDIKNKLLYKLSTTYEVQDIDYDDLNLKDILLTTGGEVVEESTKLSNNDELLYLTKQIYSNLNLWHKFKQRLYDNNIFKHDYKDKGNVEVNLDKLCTEERNIVDISLRKLKEMNMIKYSTKGGFVRVTFLDNNLKGFIFKSGTWLEIATHNLVNKLDGIDDIKSGVVFIWDTDKATLRNEIDVIAIKDSVTICISCKDSDKYDEVALNELNVYGNKIGGEDTIKILVATKEPLKTVVIERAKAMGIHIIIFDGNEKKFINQVKAVLG